MKYTLKEVQGHMYNHLKQIKELFEKNNIDFYIGCGTLLGAARHEGMIPWDDDIDIFVKFKDRDKMMKVLAELPSNYYTEDFISNDNFCSYMARSYDTNIKIRNEIYKYRDKSRHHPIIDIFYLFETDEKNVIDNWKEIKKCGLTRFLNAYAFKMRVRYRLNPLYLIYLVFYYLLMVPYIFVSNLFRNTKKADKRFLELVNKGEGDSYFIFDVTVSNYKKVVLNKDYFKDIKEFKFNDFTLPGFKDYDKYLKTYYGDWKKEIVEKCQLSYCLKKDK